MVFATATIATSAFIVRTGIRGAESRQPKLKPVDSFGERDTNLAWPRRTPGADAGAGTSTEVALRQIGFKSLEFARALASDGLSEETFFTSSERVCARFPQRRQFC